MSDPRGNAFHCYFYISKAILIWICYVLFPIYKVLNIEVSSSFSNGNEISVIKYKLWFTCEHSCKKEKLFNRKKNELFLFVTADHDVVDKTIHA
jgi:hypothetical protein